MEEDDWEESSSLKYFTNNYRILPTEIVLNYLQGLSKLSYIQPNGLCYTFCKMG